MAASDGGAVLTLDASGKQLFATKLGDEVTSPLVHTKDRALFVGNDKRAVAKQGKCGKELWSTSIFKCPVLSLHLDVDGNVVTRSEYGLALLN